MLCHLIFQGKLQDGQNIAVKLLSRASGQVISKLQHKNLVSLLGCCMEAEQNILVY